jgi:hypothetical protein
LSFFFFLFFGQLSFNTKAEAIAFANKNGWKYQEEAEEQDCILYKPGRWTYDDNFLPHRVSDGFFLL